MRQLVVCCDGTWNTRSQEHDGVPTPTNVVRIHNALLEDDDQLLYYHPGVGTGPDLLDRWRGGGLGDGLGDNVKSAYAWLSANYRDADAVCLFGFSRGAYTVRSLAGMIATCGLARLPQDDEADQEQVRHRWDVVDHLYDDVYRPAPRHHLPGRAHAEPAAVRPYPPIEITFLGVWDTVGALGIPDTIGLLHLIDGAARHRFHDTRLSPVVRHARHAVSLDETRGPFTPTLWTDLEEFSSAQSNSVVHTVRQVWFPGAHSDVGGGQRQTGLSDGALRWMIDEAAACTALRFDEELCATQIQPDAHDVLHDSCTGLFRYLAPAPRAVPLLRPDRRAPDANEDRPCVDGLVHVSALERQARASISVGRYRPTRVPAPGDTVTREVYAGQPWNHTGLYLEAGRYAVRPSGEWLNGSERIGPQGIRTPWMHWPGAHAASVMGWWQERYRDLTHDEQALLWGAPRDDDTAWMSLLGVVAARDEDEDGVQRPYRMLDLSTATTVNVPRPGYLYLFANDAWIGYTNNKGQLRVVITREA